MKENEMMEAVVNALILFVSLTLLFVWLDRTVSLKVRLMADQVDEKYTKKVMILPLKEKPQIEMTETESRLREFATKQTQKPIQWTTLPHRLRVVHPNEISGNSSEADAGLGSGASSSESLDWEEVQLLGAGTSWTVRQDDPQNPYFSEGCGIDPDQVPPGWKVN